MSHDQKQQKQCVPVSFFSLCYVPFSLTNNCVIVFSFQAHTSDEIQIIGTKNCSLRHVELIRGVDDLYNSMANINGNQCMRASESNHQAAADIIDLSQHAVEERIAKDDLVILQAKNPLILPLVQNNRFPVSDSDIKNHIAIVEIAYTRVYRSTVLFVSSSSVYFSFFGSFLFDSCFVLCYFHVFFCQELRC